jgi:DNA polymerase-3 subunit chi
MSTVKVEFRDAGDAFEREPAVFIAALVAALHRNGAHSIRICAADVAQAHRLDACLWEIDEAVFLPHALADDPDAGAAPVVIAWPEHDDVHRALTINLRETIATLDGERVIELIPANEDGKRAARERWRAYRACGIEPIKADSSGV